MKKAISFLIIFVLMMGLVACGQSTDNSAKRSRS